VWTPRLPDLQWRAIFATHARRIQLLGDANLLPDDWRKWAEKYVEGKLKRCPHTVCSLFEVENEHGVWGVEICNDCGTQTVRECAHISMRWRADDSLLICDNCGIDGT
jgi:hypothetical protein